MSPKAEMNVVNVVKTNGTWLLGDGIFCLMRKTLKFNPKEAWVIWLIYSISSKKFIKVRH